MVRDPGAFLRGLFDAAVAAADPARAIPDALPSPPRGRALVLGAGKASAVMARAIERAWSGDLSGLVVTRYGHAVACARIEVVEAGHPEPDAAGLEATERLMAFAAKAGADDLVLCPMSGGGSALMPAPLGPMTLDDEIALNRALLSSGASISEMNCVRRHASRVKGGRLAALCHPAKVVALLMSDVPGDDPKDIASGPTIADPTTRRDAIAVLRRYRVAAPAAVREVLAMEESESIKPGDPRLANGDARMIATPRKALAAAAARARADGVAAHVLADDLEGESRELAKAMAALARNVARAGEPFRPPCVLLSGGETTVTVRGAGRGGRNVEFALALAIALRGCAKVWALACDTDGIDGLGDAAGALVTPSTLERAWSRGLDPLACLDANDAHSFFAQLGDGVITGPTLTNVNDFRAIYVA